MTAVREDGGDSPCYAGMVKAEADRRKKESRTEAAPEMELPCWVVRTHSDREKHSRLIASALRLCWRAPREAWLLARMAAWVMALSGLLKVTSLPGALKLVAPRKPRSKRGAEPERLAALLDRLLRLNLFVFTPVCWKRTIILHRFLALNGLKTRVVFGVRRERDNLLTGHAWLETNGVPVLEARLPDYVVTWVFPSDPEH